MKIIILSEHILNIAIFFFNFLLLKMQLSLVRIEDCISKTIFEIKCWNKTVFHISYSHDNLPTGAALHHVHECLRNEVEALGDRLVSLERAKCWWVDVKVFLTVGGPVILVKGGNG